MLSRFPLTLAVAVVPSLIAHSSFAQDTGAFYAKVFGGYSALQGDSLSLDGVSSPLDYDGGALFGGAIGYDYADSPFLAEIEYAYRTDDASGLSGTIGSGGDFASTTVMLNGYYVFETGTSFRPYVGLGVGVVTEIDFDVEGGPGAGEYNDRNVFAYQAMLGVDYPISDRLAIYAEARYFSAGSVDLKGPGGSRLSADYDALDLAAGVAFSF